MNIGSLIEKLSEGREDAAMVLFAVSEMNESVDPKSIYKSLDTLTSLEERGVRGEQVMNLYTACNEHVGRVILTLRAVNLRILPMMEVRKAIRGQTSLDFVKLEQDVVRKVNSFNVEGV